MSHLLFQETSNLFLNHLVKAPLVIKAFIGNRVIEASLNADGSVNIGSNRYSDIQLAMKTVYPLPQSTSNAWQFWTWYSDDRQAWTPLEHLRAALDNQSASTEVKTSETHPLRIDSVAVPDVRGRIGLTFCPGKCTQGLYGGLWQRNLQSDLDEIIRWGASTLISLMEEHEFELLGVPQFLIDLPDDPKLDWLHLPITDMQIPDEHFESKWATIGPRIHQQLKDGESIAIHCRGGLGRTGLLAARLLVEFGIESTTAVDRVRQARVRSIETYSQEHYILTKAWENKS